MGTIHRIPRANGCPHNVKPHRAVKGSGTYLVFCNVCGEELGTAPTKEQAENLNAAVPPDAVESALHSWRRDDMSILEASRVFNVSPESIMLAFKDEDPQAYYLSMTKAIIGVGMALVLANLKDKLRRLRQGRLGR